MTPAYYAAHREEILAKRAAYYVANRDRKKAFVSAYYDANRTERLTYATTYRETHRAELAAKQRAYNALHPELTRGARRRRRAKQAGVLLTVRVEADYCGVCLLPLNADLRHPHPLSTTIGHEPPLSVVAREGWLIVATRPEHMLCNLRKGPLDDASLIGSKP